GGGTYHNVAGSCRSNPGCRKVNSDRGGHVVKEIGESHKPAADWQGGGSLKRSAAGVARCGDDQSIFSTSQVSKLVFQRNHRLRNERNGCSRGGRGLSLNRQMVRGRRRNSDRAGARAGQTAAGKEDSYIRDNIVSEVGKRDDATRSGESGVALQCPR